MAPGHKTLRIALLAALAGTPALLSACDKPEVRCQRAKASAHDAWTEVVRKTRERMRKREPGEDSPENLKRLLFLLEAAERARDTAGGSAGRAHEAAQAVREEPLVGTEAASAASESAWSACEPLER